MKTQFVLVAAVALSLSLHIDAQGRRTERQKPSGARVSSNQKDNLKQLKSDLMAIKSGSDVTPEMKQSLANSIKAMADGATKPSEASVTKLSTDLSAAMADGNISASDKETLAVDVQAVLRSASIPASEVQAAIKNVQTILTAANISSQEANAVITDLNAISTELRSKTQASKSKLKSTEDAARGRARQGK